MLSRIFIQNFALIDRLEINLKSGLQVITGETGAGKSIILGALRLILGERADAKSVMNSANKSIVEAEFTVSENLKDFFAQNDLDFEKNTIIRRELLPTGKSRAFINDVPVTLETLKELSQKLVDIHSQFQTAQLFTDAYQFRIIDGLSQNHQLLSDYQKHFNDLQTFRKELDHLKQKLSEGTKEKDYRDFLLQELLSADLDHTDLELIQNQLSTQENAGNISENLSQILARFDAEEIGILDSLNEVRHKLYKTAALSHHFTQINQRFEENFLELKDILFTLQDEGEKIEINPEILEELNSKLNKINTLFLKHNVNSVEELMEIRDEISGEQKGFSELEQYIADTEKKIAETEQNLTKFAKYLAKKRKSAVPVFKEKSETLLQQLGLEKANIEVQLTESKAFNLFGKEDIEILFQANAGFPMKPIESAISGGERSRVMLAIKKIMAENADLPTLILDEIDTGVSGKVAEEMGNVMREMSQDMQLIVITHLPQVAAKGDDNYKVVKKEVSGKTQSNIIPLNSEEKLQEIAQLLSGTQITQAALKQAEELMK